MPWGQGYGLPFGGTGVVPVSSPRSDVAAPPITFDFSTNPDGQLPGTWEAFILTTAGPSVTGAPEPDPAAFFSVQGGLAWFHYTLNPLSGSPFQERGLVASPAGVLQSPNGSVSVAFVSPVELRAANPKADAFTFEVLVGLHGSDDSSGFVGGRVRAAWTALGGWTTPVVLEAVQALAGQALGVVASYPFTPDSIGTDLANIWRNSHLHSLTVQLRDGALVVALDGDPVDGPWLVFANVPVLGNAKPIIRVRVYATIGGGAPVSMPCIAAIQLQTLRALARLGAAPILEGDAIMEAAPVPRIQLPISDLLAKGILKRSGARSFVFTQTIKTDVLGNDFTWNEGDIVRALEPYSGQTLVPIISDLASLRAIRERV